MWWIVWLVVCVVCAAIEAATPQLTSIWFALGAVAALVTSFIAPDLWWLQLIVFIVVSAVAVVLTRPLARKYLNKNKVSVNADRFVGAEGVVIQPINNVLGEGQIKSQGTVWSARTESDEETIDAGQTVVIKRIEGVKVIVALK
ncbi:MAG: NfeD family protein [Clostridia bacterium]|nr:NfeD family protein [Clostridia bacterium]